MENLRSPVLCWGLYGLLLFCSNSPANSLTDREYQIKAAFLYNFTNFITWPATAFANKQRPLQICVLGIDPFGPVLDATMEKATAKDGRALEVRRLAGLIEIGEAENVCHILFISHSEKDNLVAIMQTVWQHAILTVSELDDFIQYCGMVRLFKQSNKVRLEISPAALERAGLKADANLLKLSKIYDQSECQSP